jgi:hypothetical protein
MQDNPLTWPVMAAAPTPAPQPAHPASGLYGAMLAALMPSSQRTLDALTAYCATVGKANLEAMQRAMFGGPPCQK